MGMKDDDVATEKGDGVVLLPCPFCGGVNTRSGGDDKWVGVCCDDCGALGPNHYDVSRDWNTRAMIAATQQATGEGVAVLAEAVAHLSNMATAYENVDLDDWCATMPADIRASQLADATAIRVVLNALATQQAVSPPEGVGWRPIETAPKDGTDILVGCGPEYDPMFGVAYWAVGGWEMWWETGGKKHPWPQYWMPLPDLPPAPDASQDHGSSADADTHRNAADGGSSNEGGE